MTSLDDLQKHYGTPSPLAVAKEITFLDKHARRFIELSPFLVIGSFGADGLGDVSPKGDAPGFVQVLDDKTLLIPDRPGNNRIDTLGNITQNAGIGLLFMIPGVTETLRINGRARFTAEEAHLEATVAHGKQPRGGILVDVAEVYLHCSKALVRSKLWKEDYRVERSVLPSLGQMVADQAAEAGTYPEKIDVAEADKRITESVEKRLY